VLSQRAFEQEAIAPGGAGSMELRSKREFHIKARAGSTRANPASVIHIMNPEP